MASSTHCNETIAEQPYLTTTTSTITKPHASVPTSKTLVSAPRSDPRLSLTSTISTITSTPTTKSSAQAPTTKSSAQAPTTKSSAQAPTTKSSAKAPRSVPHSPFTFTTVMTKPAPPPTTASVTKPVATILMQQQSLPQSHLVRSGKFLDHHLNFPFLFHPLLLKSLYLIVNHNVSHRTGFRNCFFIILISAYFLLLASG